MTLYNDDAFYQVALPYDTELQRALRHNTTKKK